MVFVKVKPTLCPSLREGFRSHYVWWVQIKGYRLKVIGYRDRAVFLFPPPSRGRSGGDCNDNVHYKVDLYKTIPL